MFRKVASWIDAFTVYTHGRQSPEIFRRWAALTTVAGALERRTWLRAFGQVLYPNMFVVLCGGPGVGKTVAVRETEYFWRQLDGLFVAPDSVTRASLIDDLFAAKRRIMRVTETPPFVEFHSLQCAAEEFGVFIPQYEGEFINTLNKLYDCGKQFEESRRGNKGDRKKFSNPQLTILGGTTPSYLKDTLPEGAWQQGFTSRIILVYSGESVIVDDPWADVIEDEKLEKDLSHDLKNIFNLYGEFTIENDAAAVFRKWYGNGREPVPDHPKLEHYIPRRHIHLLKLSMVISASRRDNLVITLEDYQEAFNTLVEAEGFMPDVFKAMTLGGDRNVVDEAFRFLWEAAGKVREGQPKSIKEHRLVYFLLERVPAHSVDKIIEQMISANLVKVVEVGDKGQRGLWPLARPR